MFFLSGGHQQSKKTYFVPDIKRWDKGYKALANQEAKDVWLKEKGKDAKSTVGFFYPNI